MKSRTPWTSLSLIVFGLATAACGSDANESDTTSPFTTASVDAGEAPMDRCLGDAFDDDFVLQSGDAESLSGHAEAIASSAAGIVACGDGFLDVVGGGSVDLAGTCSSIAIAGDVAIVGLRSGEVVSIDLSGPSVSGSVSLGQPVHSVAIDGDTAWAAAGSAGVVALAVSSGSLSESGAVGSIADARGVAIDSAGLWVAAGAGGVALLDPSTGSSRGTAMTDSDALGVRSTADGVAVLRGVYGWDSFAVQGSTIEKSTSHETSGSVVDAAEHDGAVITAEIHTLVRHDGDVSHREERPAFGELDAPWLRAVTSHDGELFAVLGDEVVPVELAASKASPDVMVDATTVYMWGDAGERLESLVVIENMGDAPLVLGDIEAESPFEVEVQDGGDPVDGCPDAVAIPAGGSLLIAVSYTPEDRSLVTGTITLHTNDPDEPELVLTVDGNRGEPEVGSDAVDFDLLTIYGERFRLSDHLGKVVLVKMFNFGCKRCSEEFAIVENDLMAGYASSDFVAVGVNTTHRTAFAGKVVDDGDLTLPMTLDLDSTAFRHYRMPEKVFPLNIVVGRDGTILHVDTEEGLVSTEAAIDAGM